MTRLEKHIKQFKEAFENGIVRECLIIRMNNIPLCFFDWKECLHKLREFRKINIIISRLERGAVASYKNIEFIGYRSKKK